MEDESVWRTFHLWYLTPCWLPTQGAAKVGQFAFIGYRMHSVLELIQQFWTQLQLGQLPELGPWNYVLLAVLIVWQGPIATLLGGAAASAGFLRPGLVFLVGVLGNLTADIVWYSVGRKGNVERLFENGRFGGQRNRFARLKFGMRQNATKILLLAKLSAGFAVLALVTAGITRLRWRKWFPVVFIGETIWTGTLVLIGYYATEAMKQIQQGLHLVLAGTTFVAIIAIIWFIPRMLRQNEALNVTAPDDK
jgi:membrane protein DedA with SNARE-associated domain